jgi:hypothetical protein
MIPGREVFGEHTPLAAGANPIEDRVHDFTNVNGAFLARSFLLCDKWCNTVKFLVIQITCVAFARVRCGGLAVVAARHRGRLPSLSPNMRSCAVIDGQHDTTLGVIWYGRVLRRNDAYPCD